MQDCEICNPTTSGTCGANLTWEFIDGTLYIRGTGTMTNFANADAVPWAHLKDDITSVVIESGVTSIGYYAFSGCTSITNVDLGDTLKTIGNFAFNKCTSLTEVAIPDSVTTIGQSVFKDCTALETVTIGTGVKTIGNYTFYRCSSLDDVTIESMTATFGTTAFSSTAKNLTMYGYRESTAKTSAEEAGITYVVLDPIETNEPETNEPTPDTPIEADVIFTLADVSGKPGETIEVEITVDSTEELNSIALHTLTYDPSILTFKGFSDTGAIEAKCFLSSFDEDEGVITLALKEKQALTGKICKLVFEINPDIEDCTTKLGMSSLVKYGSTVISSGVESAEITVKTYVLADIDGNEEVDIDDALALFQYSMLPDIYPVTYPGDMDFTKDGKVDIDDALRLFQYSMLPDVYPIS